MWCKTLSIIKGGLEMPTERVTTSYTPLFEIRILHHYWLDDGSTVFDNLLADVQAERLRDYDVRTIVSIKPTIATERIITGLKGVCVATSLGLIVGVPESTTVQDDIVMEFTLHIVDPNFLAYTAYGLRAPATATVFQTTTNRTIRYRAHASLYSNLTGATRGAGANKRLFLSREFVAPTTADRIESIVNDAGALAQLTSDPPSSTRVTLAASASDQPVYANHADLQTLTAPSNIVGSVPDRGIELPEGVSNDVYALVRIGMVHATDPDMSCTAAGVPKTTAPVFQIRFKNRRTLWRYFNGRQPTTALSESGPHPLTYLGNPTSTQKPPIGSIKIDGDPAAITNIISEVYV